MTGIHEQGIGMTEEVKRELWRRYSILWEQSRDTLVCPVEESPFLTRTHKKST
ncbi:hypothetical protein CY34DRAFT_800122 [Suillus luteus UH-Slu-Lm8-n1]|uniref:Uncharacterized protein n=1 Tax=Suillus luteus UH-Slu-Lm8-n1 TaxID=930992 RepID=A0A0D0BUT1_9AGAM|nr:hypothetical protein CY34DRAFT_800122 [Suillus luteus UH-Slu-Lm8-n1]